MENIHFQHEKKRADNAEAATSKVEEARKKLKEENSNLKNWADTANEHCKKLEEDGMLAFEEGIFYFLFFTWLQHPEIDFLFLGSRYADQVAKWNADPSIQENGLRAWAN